MTRIKRSWYRYLQDIDPNEDNEQALDRICNLFLEANQKSVLW
jgi:hypothetical protein